MTELNNGATGGPANSLLTPENCCLMMIDYQPVPFSTVRSMDPQLLINNAIGVAKTAKAFRVPTILTSVLASNAEVPVGSNRYWISTPSSSLRNSWIYSPRMKGANTPIPVLIG